MKVFEGLCSFALLSIFALVSFSGCSDVALKEAEGTSYASNGVCIYNPDWSVLPLPNDLLNPAQQAKYVSIPSAPPLEGESVLLPFADEASYEEALAMGYAEPPYFYEIDSPLTESLKRGMNKLDGFQVNFAPKIPLSKPLDMDSIVAFDEEEDNMAEANFFFLDITDLDNIKAIAPDNYAMVFNYENRDAFPYYLYLRLIEETPDDPMFSHAIKDFEQGRTYLIVMRGLSEKGILDSEGQPLQPDWPFLVFAAADRYEDEGLRYVAPDGSLRNNVLDSKEAVWEAEGARQTTDYGLSAFENFSGGKMAREEIAVAFHFTVASNPMPDFFKLDALSSTTHEYALSPKPATNVKVTGDGVENWEIEVKEKAIDCSAPEISFDVSRPLAQANDERLQSAIRLYAVHADSYERIPATVHLEQEDTANRVVIEPDISLTQETAFIVFATNELQDATTASPMADQTYFGLVRSDAAIVDDEGQWLSPFLDSRLDALLLLAYFEFDFGGITKVEDLNDISEEALQAAGLTLSEVLSVMEALRLHYEPHIEWMLSEGIIEEREALTLLYGFKTKACQPEGGRR